jgi:hypothetical protein
MQITLNVVVKEITSTVLFTGLLLPKIIFMVQVNVASQEYMH